MRRISRASRRWIAVIIWLSGLLVFFIFGWWNVESSRKDAENRLINEAGRTAAQLASILSVPVSEMDDAGVRSIVQAAMEDDRIYAVKVEAEHGILEGQKRNYLWEPIAWDDDIAENCVQGMNPIKVDGQPEGKVEIWLSPRLTIEEEAQLFWREKIRFGFAAGLWTLILFLVFWTWGDIKRFKKYLNSEKSAVPNDSSPMAENIVLGLGQKDNPDTAGTNQEDVQTEAIKPVVNAKLGRLFQRQNPDSWLVTAGMFRQTFARGPSLISRLYADGEIAGLCHLGHMLEQAAPCIGAERLSSAAKEMQNALNDPDCKTRALPVEECARALDEVLDALCGNGQWRSRSDRVRS